MIKIAITDTITPTLKELEKTRGKGFVNQALNKGGAKAYKHIVESAKHVGTSPWNQEFKNHRRIITHDKKSKKLYDRLDKGTGGNTGVNFGKFARFKLHPDSSIMLVGYLDTKSYPMYMYNAGLMKKGKRVKGVHSRDIALDMAFGGKKELTRKQKSLFYKSGFKNIAKRGWVMRKAHPHININSVQTIMSMQVRKEFVRGVKEFKIIKKL